MHALNIEIIIIIMKTIYMIYCKPSNLAKNNIQLKLISHSTSMCRVSRSISSICTHVIPK